MMDRANLRPARCSGAIRALALALLVAIGGCHGTLSVTPEASSRELQRCTRAQRSGACWLLLSRAKRQHLNASDFSARFLEWSRRQRRRAWLVAPSERETLRSELPLGGHRSVLLDKQGADWRIVGGLFDYFPQDTPRTALMSLVRALSQKHTPALLRLMPRSFRRRWTKVSLAKALSTPMMAGEAKRLLTQLKPHLGAPIFVNGTRAVMPYGNFRVRFELENGRWRIVDLD